MPARSVVIEKLSKFTGEHHEFLTPGEYTQLAGRAGRRGHRRRRLRRRALGSVRAVRAGRGARVAPHLRADVVVPPDLQHGRQPRAALPAAAGPPPAEPVVRAVPRRPRRRGRRARPRAAPRASSREAEAAAVHPAGDVDEYRRLLAELDAARRAAHGRSDGRFENAAARRRGDRAQARRQGRRAEAGAGERAAAGPGADPGEVARAALARTTSAGRCARSRRSSCPGRSRRGASRSRRAAVDDPAPAEGPRRRAAGRRRRRRRGAPGRGRRATRCTTRPAPTSRCARRGRPTGSPATSPVSSAGCRRAARASPASSTACSACSTTWGYVEDWTLTEAGRLLTRLNSEGELVVAEALRDGRLDDIDPATMAAVVSCFTFQRRGPDSNEPMPPRRWPNQEVARRSRALDARLARPAPRRARGPPARDPPARSRVSPPRSTPGSKGDDLADVLEDEEMTGGDFVRNVKQTIDLLRQIADVAPDRDAPRRRPAPPPTRACGA